ncbi:hypothetical protein ACA910_021790 [Epithemia clementina (nom. ined.)]
MKDTSDAFGQFFLPCLHQGDVDQQDHPKMMIQVHVETKPKQVLRELETVGLATSGIPSFLGGHWTLQDFAYWRRDQATREKRHCSAQRPSCLTTTLLSSCLSGSSIDMPSSHNVSLMEAGPSVGYSSSAGIACVRTPAPAAVGLVLACKKLAELATTATPSISGGAAAGADATTKTATTKRRSDGSSDKSIVHDESEQDIDNKNSSSNCHKLVNKRRIVNMISSRKKRETQRERFRLLKDESAELVQENKRLHKEQASLQAIIEDAEKALRSACTRYGSSTNSNIAGDCGFLS